MAVDQIRRLHERMPGTLHPTRRRLGRALAEKTSCSSSRPDDGAAGEGPGPFTREHTMTDEHIGFLGASCASSVPK
jgi:hypothetical protein